jgi:predicted small secreted protein
MMRTRLALAALLLATVTAGCGKELVVGGQKHVDAAGTGDGTPEGSASKAPAYARLTGAEPSLARAQGTITFDARVELLTDDRQLAQLTPAPATVTVRIDGADSVHIAAGDVAAARYTAVRVTFTRVQANVTGGLVIGGVNVTGLVSVGLAPGESVVVERAVDLGSPGASARLLVDLDASAWLSAANPVTRVVAASTFQSAVKVRTY